MTTVALIEFPDECDSVAAAQADVLVAIGPKTAAHVRAAGLAPVSTVPYLGPEAHEALARASEAATAWMWKRIASPEHLPYAYSYQLTLIWNLRLACHHFVWLLELLHRVTTAHAASRIAVGSPLSVRPEGRLIWPRERYLGVIARAFAARHGLAFQSWASDHGPRGKRVREDIRAWHPKQWVGKFLGPLYWWQWQLRANGARCCITSREYQLPVVAETLRAAHSGCLVGCLDGWRLGSWARAPRRARAALARMTEGMAEAIAREPERFTWHGVNCAEYLRVKLLRGIAPFLTHLLRRTARTERLLAMLRPQMVLSCGNRDDDAIVGEMCRARGIAALMLPHGSFTPPETAAARSEWGEQSKRLIRAPFPWVAAQSPLAEAFLRALPAAAQPVRTGPILWGRPADRERARACRDRLLAATGAERLVLYAGTPKGRGAHRFFVYETPDEYLASVQAIAAAVLADPALALIIKFRPSYEIDAASLRAAFPPSPRLVIDEGAPVRDLLGAADLFVSFSSTMIEEALQNAVPVLLYGGGGRYRHVPAEVLRDGDPVPPKAVYAVAEARRLRRAIPAILRAHADGKGRDALFAPYRFAPEECESITKIINPNTSYFKP